MINGSQTSVGGFHISVRLDYMFFKPQIKSLTGISWAQSYPAMFKL